MKRAWQFILAAFAAGFVAVLCAVGYAWWLGALTPERLDAAARALRGETPPAAAEAKPEPTDLASRYAAEAVQEAQKAVADLKRQEEMLAVRLNERRAELVKIEGEAARLRRELSAQAETLARDAKAFADAKSEHERLVKSVGFRKEVETFVNMKERDAARHLYRIDAGLAVELLKAFPGDFRARVIEEIDRIDRLPENAKAAAKAPAMLRGLWPGDATAGRQ